MINLLSIRCGLAFAPYFTAGAAEFIREGVSTSRVVRQGGSGLILRSDGEIVLRFQNREEQFGREEATHYSATIGFREEYYQVVRMEDEVIMANVTNELLLSHPQSELWLTEQAVAVLLKSFVSDSGYSKPSGLPEWLSVSLGGGRLLLSDQRTGRWVLLSEDHVRELERRLPLLKSAGPGASPEQPQAISVKGVTVRLQSALTLAETLEEFAVTGRFQPFTDRAPAFSLSVRQATEGIEIADENLRVGMTTKEARKWTDVIRAELTRLNCTRVTRGKIRTVFADGEPGRWVLQWGDEVLVPRERRPACLQAFASQSKTEQASLNAHPLASREPQAGMPALPGTLEIKRADGFLLLLESSTGACVALKDNEVEELFGVTVA